MEDSKFYSINNNEFTIDFEIKNGQNANVRDLGYIIVPDGRLITIEYGNTHGKAIAEYLSKFLEQDISKYIPLNQAKEILTNEGHILYVGTGGVGYTNKNTSISGSNTLRGIIYLPDNITKNQAKDIIDLLNTNKSLFGEELYQIECEFTSQNYICQTDELLEKCHKICKSKTRE